MGTLGAAAPHLERVVAERPGDVDAGLLLAAAYERLGRRAEAARVAARLATVAGDALDAYRRLAGDGLPPDAWAREFQRFTATDPALLTRALGLDLEAEQLAAGGRVTGDPGASGGLVVAFDRSRDPAGVVVNGPSSLYLAQGAWVARVLGRASAAGTGALAIVRVFADTRPLAAREILAPEVGEGGGLDVTVPFFHDDQAVRVAVQVEATGRANLTLDRVRIEPDLRGTLRHRLAAVPALSGRRH